MEIRSVRPEEFDTVGSLTVAAYEREARLNGHGDYVRAGGQFHSSYAASLRDVASRAASAVVLVAVEGGNVLGSVTYVPGLGPFAEFDDPDAAGIRMLAVDPSAQGRGVGSALVKACIKAARESGRLQVVLHSTGWMVTAHRIYGRLGFRRAPKHDWSPDDGVHLRGYVLDLNEAGAPFARFE